MKKFVCFLLLLVLQFCLHAQKKIYIDSLKYELEHRKTNDSIKVSILSLLNDALKYSKPEEAKNFALKEIEVSKQIDYKFGLASGNMHVGDYYLNKNDSDSALFYYDISKKLFHELNYTTGLIFINHATSIVKEVNGELDEAIALTKETMQLIEDHEEEGDYKTKLIGAQHDALSLRYTEKGNFKIALIHALEALKCFEKTNYDSRKAGVLEQLGTIETGLKNYHAAIPYFKKAIEIFEKEDQKWSLAYANNELGSAYHNMGDLKNAKIKYDKAIIYAKEVEDNMALADILNAYANLEIENNNYIYAKKLLLESKKIAEESNFPLTLAKTNHELSKIEFNNNNYTRALAYNDNAIKLAKPENALPYLKRFYAYRSLILQSQNNYKDALVSYKAYQEITDSMYSIVKTEQIQELKTIYETEKKEQQILLQQNNINLLERKSEIDNLYKILLGLTLLLSIIGFYALRQKLKRSKTEKEKLNLELDYKKKELTTHALHLAKKNEVLENLKKQAKAFKASEHSQKGYNQLIRTINFDLKDDNNWENFSRYFEQVHTDFNITVKQKFPEVTSNELRLMALLKMNLTSKEIASILNISPEGIKKARYRLRKKLGITTEDSLQDLVLNL